MKFKIKKSILLENLNIVNEGTSTKNLLPQLECIKMELSDLGLSLTTTDNNISINTVINSSNIEQITRGGNVLVPSKYLCEIIRKTSDEFVNLDQTTENSLTVYTDTYKTTINSVQYELFPQVNFDKTRDFISMDKKQFKEIMNKVLFCTSNKEDRPILTGVNLDIANNKLECTATDTHRLSKTSCNIETENTYNISIPKSNIIKLSKILDDNGVVEISVHNTHALFMFDNVCFQSKLLAGSYPNTKSAIASDFAIVASLNKTDMLRALDRISLFTNTVKVILNNNSMILSTGLLEVGNMEEKVNVEVTCNEEFVIYMNVSYLLEAMRVLPKEEILINFNKNIDPVIIINKDNNDTVELVLPIMSAN